jgi:DNA-binding transcriptional MerR regulator
MEDLISKKELLELTGISYGQLYRWKRKNLIPEDWFIKKSSYTGQETFFQKDRMLERVKQIMEMKDDVSLDDLAERFSPSMPEEMVISGEDIKLRNIVSKDILALYTNMYQGKKEFTFQDLLYMEMVSELIEKRNLSLEDAEKAIRIVSENYGELKDKDPAISIFRKLGVTMVFLHRSDGYLKADVDAIVSSYSLRTAVENLKHKLG